MRSERGALNHHKKRKPAHSNKDPGQSVQFSSVMSNSLRSRGLQHTRPPCPSPSPGTCSNLMSMESVMPSNHLILCYPPSPPACSLSQHQGLFHSVSSSQRIGVSASAPVLPMNIQDWFPSELSGWISLQSKGLSRVFSNTTVQKHQFFGTQLSL